MEKPDFFQANLNRLMIDKGWSLKRLALEAKVSYHTVFRAISKGILPRGGNQQKLAGAVGVTVSYLHEDPAKNQRPQQSGHSPNPPPDSNQPDPVYNRLIHAKSSLERPSDFLHLLDLFLDAPENIRAVILALLASDQRIAEPYYSDFAARRARLLKSP